MSDKDKDILIAGLVMLVGIYITEIKEFADYALKITEDVEGACLKNLLTQWQKESEKRFAQQR